MPEIELELSLSRSSGVLAGIVASLAQAGIELKSQKLRRAGEGRGGWLSILGEGELPEPSILAERLNSTRGVDRLVRMVVDGETVLAEGKPLADQIQAGDLAELSAGSASETDVSSTADGNPYIREPERAGEPRAPGARQGPAIEDAPILSNPEWDDEPPPRPRPAARVAPTSPPSPDELPPLLVDDESAESGAESASARSARSPESDHLLDEELIAALGSDSADKGEADEELATALGVEPADSGEEPPAPEFAAEPSAEEDLADALAQGEDGALAQEDDEELASDACEQASDDEKDSDRMKVTLRRRRRRRK